MKRIEETGKGGLIKIAKNLVAQKKELLGQVDNLQLEYQKLVGEHQPKIDKLQAKAEDLAKEFRRLYSESQEAYSSGDGASAKSLSVTGHSVEDRCKAINSQANVLRSELKAILNQIEKLRQKSRECQIQTDECYKQATEMRETYVRSFGLSKIVDNTDIEEFLDGFPQKIFGKIENIRFEDKLIGNESATIVGNHHWDEKSGKFEIKIYRHISENGLKRTIAHEIGHTIFRSFMKDIERWQWGEWYLESIKSKRFIFGKDSENREDDFCDYFIAFKMKPEKLIEFDQKRFDFIKKIYDNIEQGENHEKNQTRRN